jgi:nucleoside-diphosphate-sugar epimerase
MSAFLVTGGAGFIGSHIAEALVGLGERVRVLDNFSTGKKENLAPFQGRIELIEGDIRDAEICRRAAEGMDRVIHQAAFVSVPGSVEDPRLNNEVNITGTLNMLLAARDAGVRSFVLASSSAVYGDDPDLPKKETAGTRPGSPYAVSKLAGEAYARIFDRLFGIKTIALRYFNVFGPRQDPGSPYAAVIPRFIGRLLRDEPPVIYGDGGQTRDFVYAADVVQANLLASRADRAAGGVYNIAGGSGITVNELAAGIGAALNKRMKPVHEPERLGDVRHSRADISAAGRDLGFAPGVSFEEGLALTVGWFRERA